MANKNYYYLKLKENFFESDELKILESMENGYLYSNILLKLYLKALKNEGRLTFNEFIPYDVKMLATITGHNIDIMDKALTIFKSMGLIEVLDNGTIYMLNMQQMIGSISSEGIRKAEYREKIKLEKQSGTKLGQCPDIISISNSNSNSISNSDSNLKEKEKEKEGVLNKVDHHSTKFNEPTIEEVYEYANSRGRGDLAKNFYDYYTATNWCSADGKKVKSWKGKFVTWEMKSPKQTQKPNTYDILKKMYEEEIIKNGNNESNGNEDFSIF